MNPQSISLTDGGLIILYQAFFTKEASDAYFSKLLSECAWEQKPGIFGYMQPRLIASYGDAGVVYRYSGTTNVALPWTETLLEIKHKTESVYGDYNYCLANRYRFGSDSMGWHADDEPEMGDVIGSVSLGATRKFRIRHNTTRETQTFQLEHGSLLIMAGTMQRFWQHEVPKTKRPVGERINLTFRKITNR
jgi:alkylated DNA repair dioxygenase AlkB